MGSVYSAHDIAMCRQRIDPHEWQALGGTALGPVAEWSDRACGLAALRMILTAFGHRAPPLTELVTTGVARGAFTDRGWLHADLADMATGLGAPAQAEAVTAAALPGRLEEGPAIASVTLGFPADGRRGGHLVVLRGYELDAADPLILFRDPSAWGQQHDRVLLSTLAHSYTGRCITFKADVPPARTDTP